MSIGLNRYREHYNRDIKVYGLEALTNKPKGQGPFYDMYVALHVDQYVKYGYPTVKLYNFEMEFGARTFKAHLDE